MPRSAAAQRRRGGAKRRKRPRDRRQKGRAARTDRRARLERGFQYGQLYPKYDLEAFDRNLKYVQAGGTGKKDKNEAKHSEAALSRFFVFY